MKAKEEFVRKYGRKALPLISDEQGIRFADFTPDKECLSDLNALLMKEFIKYHKWLQKNKLTEIKHSHKECADNYLNPEQQ